MGGTRRLSTPIRRYLAWLWLYLVPRWWSLYVPRWSWKIFRNLSRRTFRHRTTFTLAIEFLLLVHNTSETLVLLAQYQLRRDNGSMFSRRRLCFFSKQFLWEHLRLGTELSLVVACKTTWIREIRRRWWNWDAPYSCSRHCYVRWSKVKSASWRRCALWKI